MSIAYRSNLTILADEFFLSLATSIYPSSNSACPMLLVFFHSLVYEIFMKCQLLLGSAPGVGYTQPRPVKPEDVQTGLLSSGRVGSPEDSMLPLSELSTPFPCADAILSGFKIGFGQFSFSFSGVCYLFLPKGFHRPSILITAVPSHRALWGKGYKLRHTHVHKHIDVHLKHS